jgi:hypothetical protein
MAAASAAVAPTFFNIHALLFGTSSFVRRIPPAEVCAAEETWPRLYSAARGIGSGAAV